MAPIRVKLNVKASPDPSPSSRVAKKSPKLTTSNTKPKPKPKRAPKKTAPKRAAPKKAAPKKKATANSKPRTKNTRKKPAEKPLPEEGNLPPGHFMRPLSISSLVSDISYATGFGDDEYLEFNRNNPVEQLMSDDFVEGSAIQMVMQSIEQLEEMSSTYVYNIAYPRWYKAKAEPVLPTPCLEYEGSEYTEIEGENGGRDMVEDDEDDDGE